MEAAERLLTYDTNTKDYSLRRTLGALASCGHADALPALMRIKEHCARYHMAGEWAGTVAALGTLEAGDALLSFLLEGTKPRDSYGGRDLARAVANIAEEAPSLQRRILELARSGDQQAQKIAGNVIRNICTEDFMREVLSLPALTVRHLGGAIADALRDICIEGRPAEGGDQAYERAPRAIPALRADLFARVVSGDESSATCARLLQVIDDWREGYGEPAGEPRHPNLTLGKPWPPLAQLAWDAAVQLRRQGAETSQAARAKIGERP
jgi:hypothetical protein